MAIKIVDDQPDPDVVKRVSCRNCGAKLEYVPADTKEGKRTDYTGDTDYYRYLDCPKCSERVIVRPY